ncbi:MAG: DivIVA domain-containing protein [Clostridia bacterium]|nr:DivIVA domain-containing protein [Clostridia bacterium]
MKREDIVNKRFSRMVFGYSPMQVDAFLDEIVLSLEEDCARGDAEFVARDVELARLKAALARVSDEREALAAQNRALSEENARLTDENKQAQERLKILAREIKKFRQ